jgi:hypothetical protein
MKRIETEIWESTADNPGMVKHVGQRTALEVFKELEHRLESTGHLPDEYFSLWHGWENGREIPESADIFCTTDYGASEGIYLDVYLKWYEDQRPVTERFATGKTLGETESDLDRMYLVASAVTKAFHSDGVHARYIQLGGPDESGGYIMHLNGAERRILIDSLVDRRCLLLDETQDVERLLRRVAGSITEYINEVGRRPLNINDFDATVLAMHDGNLSAFNDAYRNVPDRIDELLEYAAGRPGNVGKEITAILLADAKDISKEMYLNACKKALGTGDADRVLLLAERAESCVADLDMGFYGEVIDEALLGRRAHIARALIEQCSSEQIKAADPRLLPHAIYNREYSLALRLVEKGIDGNKCAAETIQALVCHGHYRGYFRIYLERGMQVDNLNYSAMQACIKTDSAETAKLLLDGGMDFDLYTEWADENGIALKTGDTFNAVRYYWENEVKQEVEMNDSGQIMDGM